MAHVEALAETARASPGAEPRVSSALRLPYLDGLRAVAAGYVVMFHAALGFSSQGLTGGWRVLRRALAYGHEAVAIFIVLSGYCLMLPVVQKRPQLLTVQLGRFFRRRALRILPPYFIALAASILLLATVAPLRNANTGTIWDESLPGLELGPILSHALLVHNWFPQWFVQINGPLWSVATEWQIYFFFPLLLLPVWRRFGAGAALAAAAVVGYAPLLLVPSAAAAAVSWYLLLFAFGMLAAAIGFASPTPALRKLAGLPWGALSLGGWGFCALFSVAAAQVWFSSKPVTDALVGLATAASLVHLTTRSAQLPAERGAVLRLLESRPLVALGHFSYSLYLTHLPVVALCFFALQPLALPPPALTLSLLFVSGCASLGVAYVFHLGCERPFIPRR